MVKQTSFVEKEALLIAEEILKMVAKPNNHFTENMREYICDKLDITEKSLTDALDIIAKINENNLA